MGLKERLAHALEAQEICPGCGCKVELGQVKCLRCKKDVKWVDIKVKRITGEKGVVFKFLTEALRGE